MAKKTGDYQIPFDNRGNQLHYPDAWPNDPVRWRDNYQFDDVLRFVETRRGRSAAYFVFKTDAGKEVTMFLKDFEDMMKNTTIYQGATQPSTFTFTKRGQNYGVKWVG